jgi:glucosylceramidase
MIRFGRWSTAVKSIFAPLVLGSVLLISLCPHGAASGETVEVWLTTGDEKAKLNESKTVFKSGNGSDSLKIEVLDDPNNRYQEMKGFGAAMTGSSAYLLNELKNNNTIYTEVMNDLFNKTRGIGISYVRLPMGASDFALSSYTYDEMQSSQVDLNPTKFSIDHDKDYIIPVLKDGS